MKDDVVVLECGAGEIPRDLSAMIRKGAIYFALSIVVLGIVGAVMGMMADGHKVMTALTETPIGVVLAMLGLALLNYTLRAVRFRYYAHEMGLRTNFTEMLVYYVSGFSMSMSPGKLGEMARLWFLKRRYDFDYHKGLALQIADRLNDVLATLILCVLGMVQFDQYRLPVLGLAVAVMVAVALLMWPAFVRNAVRLAYRVLRIKPRFFVRIQHMLDHVSFMFRPRVMSYSLLLGITGWAAECLALYLVLDALGAPINFLASLFIFSFANIAGGLMLLPGGLGGVELTMITLLSLNHVPPDIAAAGTVCVRLCTLWFGVSVGFAGLPCSFRFATKKV